MYFVLNIFICNIQLQVLLFGQEFDMFQGWTIWFLRGEGSEDLISA